MYCHDIIMEDAQVIGKHCMITIRNIGNPEKLKYIKDVEPILDTIARECSLNVVTKSGHQFTPWGVTFVHVLAESHMSIHTYPENATAYMDIFCCSSSFSPDKAKEVIEHMFAPCTVECQTFIR